MAAGLSYTSKLPRILAAAGAGNKFAGRHCILGLYIRDLLCRKKGKRERKGKKKERGI
jgi:hypothetical protein